jgi:hypothetical protein
MMKLGWLLFQYAPPDLKLSRAQKREARQRTWRLYRTTLSSLVICLGTATLLGVVYGAALMLVDRVYLGRLYPVVVVFGPLLVVALTWASIAFAGRWIYGKAHYEALREMGFEVCANCGYWLRGLGDDVAYCPECGARREAMNASSMAEMSP